MTRSAKRLLLGAALLLGVPVLLALLLLGGIGLLQTAAGERWLASRLGDWTSTPDRTVTVSGLAVSWPLDLRAERVELADRAGTWSVLRDVRLDWQPRALLSGTFAAETLAVGQGELRRAPLPAEAQVTAAGDESPLALPRLPLAVRIERIAADLRVSPELTGEALALSAAGSAALQSERLDIDLALRRQGAADPEAHARIGYAGGNLAVDVGVERPISALLIRLADAAGQVPAMTLTIKGDGPLADWRGTVLGTIGPQACLDGGIRLARSAGFDVSSQAAFAPECLPDPAVAKALAGTPVTAAADFAIEDSRVTRIAQARIDTAAGSAAVSGTLVGRLGVRFAVETQALDRWGGLAGIAASGGIKAEGTLTGSFAQPVIEAEATSLQGAIGAAAWRDLATRVQVTPTPAGWLLAATGQAAPAEGLGPLQGPVTWSGTVHSDRSRSLYRLADLRVGGGGATASLFGTLTADGGVALRGLIRSPRLEAFRDLAGLPLQGRAAASVTIAGNAGGAVSIAVLGQATGFASGDANLDTLLGPAPRLDASVSARGGTLPIVDAAVTGAHARLSISGRALPGLMLGWRLELPELAALPDAGLNGSAAAHGLVTGPLSAPAVAGVAQGSVVRDGRSFDIGAAIGVRDLAAAPSGGLHLTIAGDRLQAEAASRFVLGDVLRLDDLDIASAGGRVTGALAVAEGTASGRLQGRIADLAPWSDLAGVPLAGSLTVDARLANERGQSVAATIAGEGLRLAETGVGRLEGRAEASDLLTAPKGSARVRAAAVTAGGTTLQSLDVSAEGAAEAVDVRLAARGTAGERPLSVDAQGTLRAAGEAQTLRLAALSFQGAGISGRLLQPAAIIRTPDAVTVEPARLQVGEGRIELAGGMRGRALDVQVNIDRTPVGLAEAYLPQDYNAVGTVSAKARITGTLAQPAVVLDARGQGLGLAGAGRERLDATVSARWENSLLALDARTQGTLGSAARLEARLPLRPDLTVPADGAIRGRLQADGDLGRLTAALPLPGHRFAGKLTADLVLAGTVGQPRIDGQSRLREGFYEYYETGTQLRDIEAQLTAREAGTFALTLTATDDRRRGRLSGEGRVEVGDAGLAWNVGLTASDFRLVDLDAARARASGQLTFTGLGENGELAGRLEIGPAEYHVTEGLFGGGVPKLDVIEVNRPGNRPAREVRRAAPDVSQDEPDLAFPVNIALAVEADVNRLFVRAQSLESHWRGSLNIGGTARDPSVSGELQVVRGAYDFIGKRFDLTDSRIIFDGGPVNPRLDITAEAAANDITAQVLVSGTLDKPAITFGSSPSLPSDEVLARLLFGRSIGQLSVAQQVQIARAAASLTGAGGFDPIGNLRSQLGLDLLDIGVAEDSDGLDPSVTVGKYLDEDTFLRVEEGLGQKQGNVTVERRLGRGLSVEAEVGRRGSGGIGLNWRKDY